MDYTNALIGCLKEQTLPLSRHILENGQSVWVRRQNSGNPQIYYHLLNFISKRLLNLPILQAAYANKKQAIADEVARLISLENSTINAPRLLAYNEYGLMMSDVAQGKTAPTLSDCLQSIVEKQENPLETWCNALKSLINLHQKQQYLSQAFVRNILWVDTEWFFIDFEEDPARLLSIEECQVRDYLLFLHSSAYFLGKYMSQAVAFWQQEISQQLPLLYPILQENFKKIAKINKLKFIKYLGRDGYRLSQSLAFIALLEQMH